MLAVGLQDFEKGSVKLFSKAVRHYDELANRLNKCGHSLSVFACALDQVGLAEMHPAVHYTGEGFRAWNDRQQLF